MNKGTALYVKKFNLKCIVMTRFGFKGVIMILTFLVVYTFAYHYTLQPLFKEKENANLKLKDLNQKLNKKYYEVINFYKNNNVNEINKKINSFFNQDNSNYILKEMVNPLLISLPSYSNQVNILSPNCFLKIIEIQSNFSSHFNNIVRFLNKISKSNSPLILKNFKWVFSSEKPNANNHGIHFFISGYVPYFNKALKILDKKYKPVYKNNFPSKNRLIKFPLQKIKLIGFLSKNNNKFALVKLVDNQVCKVKIGDYLGVEHYTVVGIYNGEIFIQDKNLKKIKSIKFKMGE
ncbi:hypothetical protein RICGR_1206 [Rickettsiella grylli]|uniref:Type IV pilus biogenesis protein PilP n=1 Tax=Rickettsiella grylli TaxID=59196 RepID=A8PP55_9COXI|nr:hypothetical protein RICGR_1206 [Rickettsiella grylli]